MKQFLLLFILGILVVADSNRRIVSNSSQNPIVPPPPTSRADRFGIYNWNVSDLVFPEDGSIDRLNWAANKVGEMGTRTIRVAMSPRNDYKLDMPKNASLAEIARHSAYDKLFRDPRFQTYMLTAYSVGSVASDWSDGYTQAEYNAERDEIKNLSEYLLSNPAYANKTFIIFNWEGDNAMYYNSNKRVVWDYFTSWIRARIEGVNLAKQKYAASSVHLYSGLEFNAVNSLKTGQPCGTMVGDPIRNDPLQNRCVIDYVAPQVEADYYSYSSWQSIGEKNTDPNADLKRIYKDALSFALAKVKAARPDVTEHNFIVGEYGFERSRYGECYAANNLNEAFEAFDGPDGFHVSYAIFWQIIDHPKIYGALEEHYGLFRVRDGELKPTLLSETFQKRIAGQQVSPQVGCPRIRRPPEPWGILTHDGSTDFKLNPDSTFSAYVPNCCQNPVSPFSASGNQVHFGQGAKSFEIRGDNAALWYESPTQINFSIPPARRPGPGWIYITDARGYESNAQYIHLSCADCPQIKDSCGILEETYLTARIEPNDTISIFGSRFSPSGNSVVIEQLESQHKTNSITLTGKDLVFESSSHIVLKLPPGLNLDYGTILYVIDQQGRESSEAPLSIAPPCQQCGPRLHPCQGIINEAGGFFAGAPAAVVGRFPTTGNKVVVEQVDQQNRVYQYNLAEGSPQWNESDKRLQFTLPITLFAGRALIYAVDAQGIESRAQEIVISPTPIMTVSAASYRGPSLAPESIVTAFGTAMATTTQPANTTPLPTEIAGTRVIVRDSTGTERNAPLFFISPTQVNYQIPQGTADGNLTITLINGYGSSTNGSAQIVKVAPGVFSANSNGKGVAAAVTLRSQGAHEPIYEAVATYDEARKQFIPIPIDLSNSEQEVYLILFGTGIRSRTAQSAVTARVGGMNAAVSFADAHPSLIGVDQINVRLSHELANRGEVDVSINVDGMETNTVKINIK